MNQIINIGVDTIEIDRVVRSCRRQYFLDHIFSEKEIEQMDSGKRRAASDFAGKGFSQGVEACQIEILRHEDGSPYVVLHGQAEKIAQDLGIRQWKISITNTRTEATAFVLGLGPDGQPSGKSGERHIL